MDFYEFQFMQTVERPNGKFFDGYFYWYHTWYGAEYEEEWGRQWIDGMDYEFASMHAFFNKTGITRPRVVEDV